MITCFCIGERSHLRQLTLTSMLSTTDAQPILMWLAQYNFHRIREQVSQIPHFPWDLNLHAPVCLKTSKKFPLTGFSKTPAHSASAPVPISPINLVTPFPPTGKEFKIETCAGLFAEVRV